MSLPSPQGLTFWCHNIGRSHSSWLALLSEWGELGPDVVLIQEPPVSSYEANEVLTPTVPKQQWRPVSENELAYTAASAQCWVHA